MTEADVRAWIRGHPIHWEVLPLDEVRDHRVVRVGLKLTLSTGSDGCGFMPGSPERRALYRGLKDVAGLVLPSSPGAVRCEIEGYDGASHLAPDGMPQVELSIRVAHAADYFQPLDDDERSVARGIQERLSILQPATPAAKLLRGPRPGQ